MRLVWANKYNIRHIAIIIIQEMSSKIYVQVLVVLEIQTLNRKKQLLTNLYRLETAVDVTNMNRYNPSSAHQTDII